jgi:hypothetical protein
MSHSIAAVAYWSTPVLGTVLEGISTVATSERVRFHGSRVRRRFTFGRTDPQSMLLRVVVLVSPKVGNEELHCRLGPFPTFRENI